MSPAVRAHIGVGGWNLLEFDLKVSKTRGFSWRCPNVQAQMQWEDLNWERTTYSAFGAYSQSKLANVLFSAELARRIEGTGVRLFMLVS